MKIAFLGPGWPWRGGIAQFLTLMAEQVEVEHQVKIFSFIKQYPKLIFPGKDQINRSKNKSNLPTESVLIPYNPFTWEKTEKKIRDWQPDILVVKYWIPFFAPAFGYIIRKYKKQSCGKVVYVIHNITFHEKWAFADKLSRYALGKADRLICMSDSVYQDAKKLLPQANLVKGFHPTYNCYDLQNYSRSSARTELGMIGKKVILFFGYIKPYKGLGLLLKAMPLIKQKLPKAHLLIVGEVYGDDSLYLDLIDKLHLNEDVTFVRRFVANEEVELYFKAADVLALPYLSATQSGVVQIAYDMELGAVCTPVGGLPELVINNQTGIVAESVNEVALCKAFVEYFNLDLESVKKNIIEESKRFSWNEFVKLIF